MVGAGRRLPGLPALLPGLERRRDRRPRGHRDPARAPGVARRRRHLDLADLPVADGRLRLRRRGLPRHRPGLRHPRRLRSPRRGRPRARDPGPARLRPQPLLGPAPLVPRVPLEPRQPAPRLVPVGRSRAGRRPAQQLAERVRRSGLGVGRAHGPVLLSRVHQGATRPQLAQPGRAGRDVRRPPILAGSRRGRVPRGRHVAPGQGRPAARQPAGPRLDARSPGVVLPAAGHLHHRPPRDDGHRGRHARGPRRVRRPGADRRDLPALRAPGRLLRLASRPAGRAPAVQLPPAAGPMGGRRDHGGDHRLRGRASGARLAQLGAGQPRPAAARVARRAGRRRGSPRCCC